MRDQVLIFLFFEVFCNHFLNVISVMCLSIVIVVSLCIEVKDEIFPDLSENEFHDNIETVVDFQIDARFVFSHGLRRSNNLL